MRSTQQKHGIFIALHSTVLQDVHNRYWDYSNQDVIYIFKPYKIFWFSVFMQSEADFNATGVSRVNILGLVNFLLYNSLVSL